MEITNFSMPSGMMSSKRIAEKTGKRHDHVIRDIRVMVEDLEKNHSPILGTESYRETRLPNLNIAEIFLNERLCICLASGYSITLRMMIIDDWAEMKRAASPFLPATYIQALEALVIAEKEKEHIQKQLAEAKPKADYADTVLDTTSELTTTVMAKELGFTSAVKLNMELKKRGIQFKQAKIWVLTAKYSGLGYTRLRTHVRRDNEGFATTEHLLVWTEKGREFLHRTFETKPIAA